MGLEKTYIRQLDISYLKKRQKENESPDSVLMLKLSNSEDKTSDSETIAIEKTI